MQKDDEKNEKTNIINMLSKYIPLEIWNQGFALLVLHCNLSKMSNQQFFFLT